MDALTDAVKDFERLASSAVPERRGGFPERAGTCAPASVLAASNAALDALASTVGKTAGQLDALLAARVQRTQWEATAMTAATTFGALLLIYLSCAFYASFRYSVSGLEWFAGQLAKGNLAVYLTDDDRDELSRAGRLLSEARTNLRTLIKQVNALTTPLATATEEVSKVTEQTSNEIGQQQNETDQVATAMNEMASTAQEIARNPVSAAEAAKGADAEAAGAQVDEVRTLASRAQQSTREINDMIARLQAGAKNAVGVMAESQRR